MRWCYAGKNSQTMLLQGYFKLLIFTKKEQ